MHPELGGLLHYIIHPVSPGEALEKSDSEGGIGVYPPGLGDFDCEFPASDLGYSAVMLKRGVVEQGHGIARPEPEHLYYMPVICASDNGFRSVYLFL